MQIILKYNWNLSSWSKSSDMLAAFVTGELLTFNA